MSEKQIALTLGLSSSMSEKESFAPSLLETFEAFPVDNVFSCHSNAIYQAPKWIDSLPPYHSIEGVFAISLVGRGYAALYEGNRDHYLWTRWRSRNLSFVAVLTDLNRNVNDSPNLLVIFILDGLLVAFVENILSWDFGLRHGMGFDEIFSLLPGPLKSMFESFETSKREMLVVRRSEFSSFEGDIMRTVEWAISRSNIFRSDVSQASRAIFLAASKKKFGRSLP